MKVLTKSMMRGYKDGWVDITIVSFNRYGTHFKIKNGMGTHSKRCFALYVFRDNGDIQKLIP